jgi:leader peptidase (prepilin peptidase)/N-methyltransferase
VLVSLIQGIGAALIGACAGTAVLGVADHFTFERSVWPVPACRVCGKPTAPAVWVPLLGVWRRFHSCRACGAGTSWRLLVPLQGICAAVTLVVLHQYGFGLSSLSAALETYVLCAIALTDLQHRLIPTLLVYPALVFALVTSLTWPSLGLLSSALGAGVAFGCFFALSVLARLLFGEGALGDGDVSLAALIGAISGFPLVALSLAAGVLAGGIGAALALALRRSSFGGAIPYGPFLVIGVLYTLLSGDMLHATYVVL